MIIDCAPAVIARLLLVPPFYPLTTKLGSAAGSSQGIGAQLLSLLKNTLLNTSFLHDFI